ncbi:MULTISPECIES: HAMP domain-containing sensor histidine kinase [unclassified Nocardioides]|uniref:HAMP domain-containing sensor histidine kinase n=1 Tax=unclassified Nocardioides TaxID=2615069 RepID=UPI003015468F
MRTWTLPLYWRVCLINGTVFLAGTLALLLLPVSVSRRTVVSEALVLTLGLAVMLVTNALLLRASLAPIDRVVRQMATVDLLEPGQRLPTGTRGPGARLVASFNAMLDRLEAERSGSDARALAAEEEERHRIARELHDEVGQQLTVVLLGLKQVQRRAPAELVEELELVRESARAGLDDVRRVARELRPGVLDDLGLHSALAALATGFSAHGGATVRRSIAPGLPALPPATELVVYRVAQEALTNAARHARATRVELTLQRLGDRVVLGVADDGRGLVADAAGAGLRGMRERARSVGGTLEIDSAPGQGTRVRLSVPVDPS